MWEMLHNDDLVLNENKRKEVYSDVRAVQGSSRN